MIFKIDKSIIHNLKKVSVDVDLEFVHFDRMKDGNWRVTYSKSLEDNLEFIKENE